MKNFAIVSPVQRISLIGNETLFYGFPLRVEVSSEYELPPPNVGFGLVHTPRVNMGENGSKEDKHGVKLKLASVDLRSKGC